MCCQGFDVYLQEKLKILMIMSITAISILHPSEVVEDNTIDEELQKKIDKAMDEYKKGETLHFENSTEMNEWLDSL